MSITLKDGHYKVTDGYLPLIRVEGCKGHYRDPRTKEMKEIDIEYGQFGEAGAKLSKKIGEKKISNIKLTLKYSSKVDFEEPGVINPDGLGAVVSGMAGVYSLQWVTEEEAAVVVRDAEKADSIEAPDCPYKLQPGNKGKLLWLTGAPGAGKSTSAQRLARDKGFVFYEADCFGQLRNPYIPVTAEDATLSQLRQKLLSGPGLEERREAVSATREVFMGVMSGEKKLEFNDSEDAMLMKNYLRLLCADIASERDRVGGDWALASAVPALLDRQWRRHIRSLLGDDLTFIYLALTEDNLCQRIEMRHPGRADLQEIIRSYRPMFKPLEEDEEGIVTVSIDSSMEVDDVVNKILEHC